jgi:hypothetical protein
MRKQLRRNNGSILFLMLLLVCFIVVPCVIVGGQLALYNVDRVRTQTVVEAAGLVAANDLSRIVINDPNFGYVSLSNYPPIGKATCAQDGEPLPVLGINTLVGTVRQNTIIAHELDNKTMIVLAETDKTKLESTIQDLNATITAALSKDGKDNQDGQSHNDSVDNNDNIDNSGSIANNGSKNGINGQKGWTDIQGEKIQPAKDVTAFLQANLPKNIRLQSVTLTNGWLSDGGESTIAVPQPVRLAQVKPQQIKGGKYKAFVDVPVGSRSFTFAGLGPSSSLVSSATFNEADGKHICSVVKIDCTFDRETIGQSLAPFGVKACTTLQTVACCQPFAMPDVGPTGAMTLRFSGGPVPGMQNWHDFLGGAFHDNQITAYNAIGGDYPVDHQSQMIASEPLLPPNTSQQFAEHLYYWLRNGHVRPRIDAVLDMMNESFRSAPAQIYAYEFAKEGAISRRIIARDPFPIGVTSDAQNQTVVDTSIQGGMTPIIIFRDDVKTLGTTHGGRHAGQPLAGYPLNWCELADYGGDEHTASTLEKGRLGTRLTLVNAAGTALPEEAINDPNFALFQSFEGKRVFHQPRRSFYSGGLALDIEIGGTTASAAAPQAVQPANIQAILNIPSKRWVLANRKI